MSEMRTEGSPAARKDSVNGLVRRAVVLAAGLYLLVSAGYFLHYGVTSLIDDWGRSTDFTVFYSAARVLRSNDRDLLYVEKAERTFDMKLARFHFESFFNPPIAAIAYQPFTLFSPRAAQAIDIGLLLAAGAGLVVVVRFLGGGAVEQAAFALALAASYPVGWGLRIGQPALLYALLSGIAFIALERGRLNPAAAFFAAFVAKPTLLAAPIAFLAVRGPRTVLVTTICIAALLFLVPFLILGPEVFADYRALSSEVTRDAFRYFPEVTAAQSFLLNWNGYWATRLGGAPLVELILFSYGLTLLFTYKAIKEGSFREAWLASTAAMILCAPHVLSYDWTLLFLPAAAVYLERRSVPYLAALVVLHALLNFSRYQPDFFSGSGALDGYFAVPGLFLLIVYLAFREQTDAWLEARLRRRPGDAALEAPASTAGAS